jgi:hypothetical protein
MPLSSSFVAMTLEVTPISQLPTINCPNTSMSDISANSLSRVETAHQRPREHIAGAAFTRRPGRRLSQITDDRPFYWGGFFRI